MLLDKLTKIEKSIGVQTNTALRTMVLEAQDCVLEMQKTLVEDLRRQTGYSARGPLPASRRAA
jgi:hypothetical protein